MAKALELKGLAYEPVPVRGALDLRRWSPVTRKMPVLEIDGEHVFDSSLILRRLDESFPEPRLVADDPSIARRQELLEDWSDEALYWYVIALRAAPSARADAVAQVTREMGIPGPLRGLVGRQIARNFVRTTWSQGLGRLPEEVLLSEFERRLDELVALLAEAPFFFAERASVADVAVYGQLRTLDSGPTREAAERLGKRSMLGAWIARVERAGPEKR